MSRESRFRLPLVLALVLVVCAGGFLSWRWMSHSVEVQRTLVPGERVMMSSGVALTVPVVGDRVVVDFTIHWRAAWLYTDDDAWTETIVVLPQTRPDVRQVALRSYPGPPAQALRDLQNTLWFPDGPPPLRATSPDGNVTLYWDARSNKAVVVTRLPHMETGVIMVKNFPVSHGSVASPADVNEAFAAAWSELSIEGAEAPVLPEG